MHYWYIPLSQNLELFRDQPKYAGSSSSANRGETVIIQYKEDWLGTANQGSTAYILLSAHHILTL